MVNSRKKLDHIGNTVESENVTRNQNTPGVESEIVRWKIPETFHEVSYDGGRHTARIVLRTRQVVSGTPDDDTVVMLNNDIVPVYGERDLSEQDEPVVEAFNVTTGSEVPIADVDYETNTVILGQDPADGEDVFVYSILSDGLIKLQGQDYSGNVMGTTTDYGKPIQNWIDQDPRNRQTASSIDGGIDLYSNEQVALVLNSDHQVYWDDGTYPGGQYASSISLEADVEY